MTRPDLKVVPGGDGSRCGAPTSDGTPCSRSTDGSRCWQHAHEAGGSDTDAPEAPAHLSAEARAIWREISRTWHLDPAARELLRVGLESWDTYQNARRVLQEEGTVVVNPDSGNTRRHPAASVAKDSLKAFRMCLKDMGLEPLNWER